MRGSEELLDDISYRKLEKAQADLLLYHSVAVDPRIAYLSLSSTSSSGFSFTLKDFSLTFHILTLFPVFVKGE